ncbi:MFS general substrate transporter [Cryphonectria parasitica EP155]|uniref:MFS general substrate transporter n=1 Tax=Cryphonectria parasitica (strain ATCC 38755 / EP155) TaxID=660469 RepID=A0A9P4Y0Q8_CRYP1|nr:MFS general substrate transporter [Cryphonectria parasitica EP155]KAF3764260.1 MFS general substrate transporter [Cryphonectria parasitica EP155]
MEKTEDALGTADLTPESQRLLELKETYGATWDGPSDPRDPYNWKPWRKVSITLLISCGQLVTLMTASMIAAALNKIAADLGMSTSQAQIAFSIYFLGMAFAPFFIAAVSEMYGRRPVWLISNMYFVLWNTLCPVGRNKVLMILGRFMAAAGASCGVCLTGPILTDMYRPDMRGRSLALASLLPYLGPAVGPIIGGVATQHLDWPWLFYIISLFSAAIVLAGFFLLPESHTPILLGRLARAETTAAATAGAAADPQQGRALHNSNSNNGGSSFFSRLATSVRRPVWLLLRRPVMQLIALNMGLNFAMYCVMITTLASIFMARYHESETVSSLNYIAIAVGTTIEAQAGGHIMDWIWRRLTARQHGGGEGKGKPEFRLPFIAPGVITAAEAHWALVDAGVTVFVMGCFAYSAGFLAYTFDEFEHAASASAACRVYMYILGFACPIFAPILYDRLGYGWGNTLLALVLLLVGGPSVLLLWLRGEKVRALGRRS